MSTPDPLMHGGALTALTGGFHVAFAVGAAFAIVGALVALVGLPRRVPTRVAVPHRRPMAEAGR